MDKTFSWHNFYSAEVSVKDFLSNLQTHAEFIEAIFNERPQKILEVGIGTGGMGLFFSLLGIETVGVDNNDKIIKAAKNLNRKLGGKTTLTNANAFQLPFGNNSFDLIFSQGFLEHFTDQEIIRLLNEQIRVGRKVFFSVPNNFYPQKDFGDERLLSKKDWEKILAGRYEIRLSRNYLETPWVGGGIFRKGIAYLIRKYLKRQINPIMYMAAISMPMAKNDVNKNNH